MAGNTCFFCKIFALNNLINIHFSHFPYWIGKVGWKEMCFTDDCYTSIILYGIWPVAGS